MKFIKVSVDGDLKKRYLVCTNPTFYDGLFGMNEPSGRWADGGDYCCRFSGFYKENKGEWHPVDIRIAPGVEKVIF